MYETALNQSAYSQTNILLSKYIALRSKVVHAVFKTQKKYFVVSFERLYQYTI
jgi:hypothetical protein